MDEGRLHIASQDLLDLKSTDFGHFLAHRAVEVLYKSKYMQIVRNVH